MGCESTGLEFNAWLTLIALLRNVHLQRGCKAENLSLNISSWVLSSRCLKTLSSTKEIFIDYSGIERPRGLVSAGQGLVNCFLGTERLDCFKWDWRAVWTGLSGTESLTGLVLMGQRLIRLGWLAWVLVEQKVDCASCSGIERTGFIGTKRVTGCSKIETFTTLVLVGRRADWTCCSEEERGWVYWYEWDRGADWTGFHGTNGVILLVLVGQRSWLDSFQDGQAERLIWEQTEETHRPNLLTGEYQLCVT